MNVEVHLKFVTVMAERFDVSEVILRIENDEFRLSSGKEIDLEVYGYLPVPSEITVSEIGCADQPSHSAQCMLVTALIRAMPQGFCCAAATR